jgi:hypothetical protein
LQCRNTEMLADILACTSYGVGKEYKSMCSCVPVGLSIQAVPSPESTSARSNNRTRPQQLQQRPKARLESERQHQGYFGKALYM